MHRRMTLLLRKKRLPLRTLPNALAFMAGSVQALEKKSTETGSTLASRQLPHNAEAEQALIGAVLVNNELISAVSDYLRAEHFYEPVHQRIWQAMETLMNRSLVASPVTLKHYFDRDEALHDIGGGQYLAKLAGLGGAIYNVRDLGQTVYDLALKRSLIHVGSDVVNTAYDNHIEVTAIQQIEQAEQHLFNLAVEGQSDRGFQAIHLAVEESLVRAEQAYKNPTGVSGIPTQLHDLDKLLGGLQNSDLMILAGRPSMGKTALATNIAYNIAHHYWKQAQNNPEAPMGGVGFFSLEMSAEQLASRILASAAHINSGRMRKGDMNDEDFARLVKASSEVAQLPLFIDDTPALSIAALRTRSRRLKRNHGLSVLVVDYLQLVRGTASSINSGNRVQEVSEITQGLKAIAKELNIPVIALSQLSRAVEQREDKRPQLSDLRESGSIEQDADIVMFVFREEYYVARAMPPETHPKFADWQAEMERVFGIAEVIVAKQRHGPIGTVRLQFQSEFTRFSDLEGEQYMHE